MRDKLPATAIPKAKYLDIILQSKEDVFKDRNKRYIPVNTKELAASDFTIIGIRPQMENYELPLRPIKTILDSFY